MTKAELWSVLQCIIAAKRQTLTERQLDWLLESRQRCAWFEAIL